MILLLSQLSTLFSITIVSSSCLFACSFICFYWTPSIGRKVGTFLSHLTTGEGLQFGNQMSLTCQGHFQNHYHAWAQLSRADS